MDIECVSGPDGDGPRPAGLVENEAGAAILEFAIVLPILLVLLGGVFEIGRALLVRQTMIDAVRGGARALARLPAPSCSPVCPPAVAHVLALTVDAIATDAQVSRTLVRVMPRWNQDLDTVTMRASVEFEGPLLRLIGLAPLLQLHADHAERRIVE